MEKEISKEQVVNLLLGNGEKKVKGKEIITSDETALTENFFEADEVANTLTKWKVFARSRFSSDTRDLVTYENAIYALWRTSLDEYLVVSIDKKGESKALLKTKHLMPNSFIFLHDGSTLLWGKVAGKKESFISLYHGTCKWIYKFHNMTIYQVDIDQNENNFYCLMKHIDKGSIQISLCAINNMGELQWQISLPKVNPNQNAQFVLDDNTISVYYANRKIILSYTGTVIEEQEFNVVFSKVIIEKGSLITALAAPLLGKSVRQCEELNCLPPQKIFAIENYSTQEIISSPSVIVDFWILSDYIFSLSYLKQWQLTCHSTKGHFLWVTPLQSQLSCAPIVVNNKYLILITVPNEEKHSISIISLANGEISNVVGPVGGCFYARKIIEFGDNIIILYTVNSGENENKEIVSEWHIVSYDKYVMVSGNTTEEKASGCLDIE